MYGNRPDLSNRRDLCSTSTSAAGYYPWQPLAWGDDVQCSSAVETQKKIKELWQRGGWWPRGLPQQKQSHQPRPRPPSARDAGQSLCGDRQDPDAFEPSWNEEIP